MTLRSLFYWLYVASMAGGAFYFWTLSRRPKGVPQYEYLVAIFIPVWSGLAYLAMAMGQGQVEIAGQTAYYARYLDWMVSTPLLLLALSFTAMQFIEKRLDADQLTVGHSNNCDRHRAHCRLVRARLGEGRLVFYVELLRLQLCFRCCGGRCDRKANCNQKHSLSYTTNCSRMSLYCGSPIPSCGSSALLG